VLVGWHSRPFKTVGECDFGPGVAGLRLQEKVQEVDLIRQRLDAGPGIALPLILPLLSITVPSPVSGEGSKAHQ